MSSALSYWEEKEEIQVTEVRAKVGGYVGTPTVRVERLKYFQLSK